MPALNFKKQFAPLVQSGKKRQTIRATRKVPIWIGDTLYLYTEMRTKNCRRLRAVMCRDVRNIVIYKNRKTKISGVTLTLQQMNLLAMDDGFSHFKSMGDFFEQTHGLPFRGQIIRW
jgi:hypothetical protein